MPRRAATTALATIAKSRPSQKLVMPNLITRIAAAYAPVPKKAAWPKLGMLAYPQMMLRLVANSP
jgi:hypothetical protein